MEKFMLRLNSLLIFFTLLSYLSPFVSPQSMSFLMFLGLLYPYFILLNIIFIFIWAVSRYTHWRRSAICLALGIFYLTQIINFHFTEKKSTGKVLKVMSYNVNGFSTLKFKNRVEGIKQMNGFFETTDADILCLQEFLDLRYFTMSDVTAIIPYIKKYPYYFRTNQNTTAIFSKFPINNAQVFPINDNQSNGCISGDVQAGDKTIRVYCMQLQSNTISGMADGIAEKGLDKEKGLTDILRMMNHFRKAGRKRSRESEIIAASIRQSPYPVVVCGDFNDIPVSYTYHTLSESLQDAFQVAGNGLDVTYGGNIPGLRIDYVLADKKITVFNQHTDKVFYSDHYPVVSTLGLNF